MHHYPFHIADFVLATRHLSDAEELAYRRMIDEYMDSEQPLPNDRSRIARKVRSDETIVQVVLDEFFTEESDGWHNTRCDREIAAMNSKRDKAKEAGIKSGKSRGRNGSKPLVNECSTDVQRTLNGRSTSRELAKSQEPVLPSEVPPNPQGGAGQGGEPDLALSSPQQPKPPDPVMQRLGRLFRRRDSTPWSERERKALRSIAPIPDDDLALVERYYLAEIPDRDNFRRRDLQTLLSNWTGELDRARQWSAKNQPQTQPRGFFEK